MRISEPAPAKLNLALHVRGWLPDGRHALETIFAFCTDGDKVEAEAGDEFTLEIDGPFAEGLSADHRLDAFVALDRQRARAGAGPHGPRLSI